LGSVPASIISKRTNIGRSTTQYTCQQLRKKGLISSIKKNNSLVYSPESPSKIIYLLDQEKREIEKKKNKVDLIMEELEDMINPGAILPKVKFFEGVEGIVTMFEDVLRENKPLYGALKIDKNIDKNIIKYLEKEYIPKRKKLKNVSKMLFNDNEDTKKYRLNDPYVNRISLLLPIEKFPFDVCLHIYGNKIAFYSYQKKDLTGALIENELIRKTQFSMFKLAWNYARELHLNKQYSAITV